METYVWITSIVARVVPVISSRDRARTSTLARTMGIELSSMYIIYHLLNVYSIIHFRVCVCTINSIDCKATHDKIKKIILKENKIYDMNNPMLVAFDKCLIEKISDPMTPPTKATPYSEDDRVGEPLSEINPVCAERLLSGLNKCKDKMEKSGIAFMHFMNWIFAMMTEFKDLKQ